MLGFVLFMGEAGRPSPLWFIFYNGCLMCVELLSWCCFVSKVEAAISVTPS